MQSDDRICSIISRVISGEITEDERISLHQWELQSLDNAEELKDIVKLTEKFDMLDMMENVDTPASLKKVKNKLKFIYAIKKVVAYWKSVAAVIVLPLLGLVVYQFMASEEVSSMIVKTSTQPGLVAEVILPDSSIVKLNGNSSLEYPAVFTGKERNVRLSGEGYFIVNADVNRPFIVKCSDIAVEAVGTEFNVLEMISGNVATTLLKGKVNVSKNGTCRSFLQLNPGQTVVYDKNNDCLSYDNRNTNKYVAWLDGAMIFRNDPLESVFEELKRYYDVDFIFDKGIDHDYSYTGTFNRVDINQIIKYIEYTTPIRIIFEGYEDKTQIYRVSEK